MTRPTVALIFAAGLGTRMGALTRDTPKPMLPLNGAPMIDHAIGLLRAAGIDRIFANTHYLHDRIAPHLAARGVTAIHETPEVLETGGGLRNALPRLGPGPVITVNSDAIWLGPNPISALLQAWGPGMSALLHLVPLSQAHCTGPTGDFSLEQGEITRKGPYRYTGAQIVDPSRLDEIPDRVFSLNAYWNLLAASGPLHGLSYDGDWCEAGDPAGLATAERLLADV